eukprot:COSAG01_NODE_2261_length_8057_cov_38.489570_8_plen_74_part_00
MINPSRRGKGQKIASASRVMQYVDGASMDHINAMLLQPDFLDNVQNVKKKKVMQEMKNLQRRAKEVCITIVIQ